MNEVSRRALRDLRNGVVDYNTPEGRKMMEDAILQDPVGATKAMNFIPRDQIVRTMRNAGFSVAEIGHVLINDPKERAEFIKDTMGHQAAAQIEPNNPFLAAKAQADLSRQQRDREVSSAVNRQQQEALELAKNDNGDDISFAAGIAVGVGAILKSQQEAEKRLHADIDEAGQDPFGDPADEILKGPRPKWA